MIPVEHSTAKSATYRSVRSVGLPKFPAFSGIIFLIGLGFCASGPASLAQQPGSSAPTATAPQVSDAGAAPGAATNAGAPKAASQDPATQTTPGPSPAGQATAPQSQSGPGHETPKTASGGGSSLIPHDLSPYGMFMNADIVVKVVMVGLAFASLVTWTILLVKTLELFGARRRGSAALEILAKADTLRQASGELDQPKAPVSRMAQAALAEIERSRGLHAEGVKERAAALLGRIEARAGRTMGRGTGLLATIGSTAPFVGLFGTVWGIMNSFIGISRTNTTNLAVVAPGIAEALLATACGLVAAIPAVIIYNMFARGITGYRSVLGDASTEILRLLSRDLDRASESAVHAAARRQAAE